MSSPPAPGPRLFHLAAAAAWRARGSAPWAPPSLAEQGFVHLSLAGQLAGTLAAHFAAERAVVLAELDPGRVAEHLRFEPSRGGALFPHLYRAVLPEDLRGGWLVERGAAGTWRLPRIGSEPEGDDPPALRGPI